MFAKIDTRDFTTSFTDTYLIRIDDGLVNRSGITEAKVTVELSGLVTDKFVVRNISCTNLTEGYEADIITDAITVTIRGPEEQIKALKAENIRAVIDLQDFINSTGSFIVTPEIKVADFKDVGAIGEIPPVSVVLDVAKEDKP